MPLKNDSKHPRVGPPADMMMLLVWPVLLIAGGGWVADWLMRMFN